MLLGQLQHLIDLTEQGRPIQETSPVHPLRSQEGDHLILIAFGWVFVVLAGGLTNSVRSSRRGLLGFISVARCALTVRANASMDDSNRFCRPANNMRVCTRRWRPSRLAPVRECDAVVIQHRGQDEFGCVRGQVSESDFLTMRSGNASLNKRRSDSSALPSPHQVPWA